MLIWNQIQAMYSRSTSQIGATRRLVNGQRMAAISRFPIAFSFVVYVVGCCFGVVIIPVVSSVSFCDVSYVTPVLHHKTGHKRRTYAYNDLHINPYKNRHRNCSLCFSDTMYAVGFGEAEPPRNPL